MDKVLADEMGVQLVEFAPNEFHIIDEQVPKTRRMVRRVLAIDVDGDAREVAWTFWDGYTLGKRRGTEGYSQFNDVEASTEEADPSVRIEQLEERIAHLERRLDRVWPMEERRR